MSLKSVERFLSFDYQTGGTVTFLFPCKIWTENKMIFLFIHRGMSDSLSKKTGELLKFQTGLRHSER